MTHEHEHPAAGYLAFPGGGVVTGAPRTVEERILGGEAVSDEEIAARPGVHVEIVSGTMEGAARHWNARHGHQTAGDMPADAHRMPSGHWVQMADPRILDRNAKREIVKGGSVIGDAATRAFFITDQLHRRLITAWSYPYPLPSADIESLGRLPLEDDEPLGELLEDARKVLFPKTEVTPDDHADPESPTAPSGA